MCEHGLTECNTSEWKATSKKEKFRKKKSRASLCTRKTGILVVVHGKKCLTLNICRHTGNLEEFL